MKIITTRTLLCVDLTGFKPPRHKLTRLAKAVVIATVACVCLIARSTAAVGETISDRNITLSETLRALAGGSSPQSYLLLLSPSIPLESSTANDDRAKEIADSAVAASWLATLDPELQLADVLRDVSARGVFKSKNVASDEEDSAKAARALLYDSQGKPSEVLKEYQQKRKALDELETQLSQVEEGDPARIILLSKLQTAKQAFVLWPTRKGIEQALRELAKAENAEPGSAQSFAAAVAKYEGPSFWPPVSRWNEDGGWVKVDLPLKSSGLNGLPGRYKLKPETGNVSGWSGPQTGQLPSNAQITMEVKKVDIQRASFNPAILSAGSWTMPDGSILSNGASLDSEETLSGKFPALITGFVLARRIHLKFPETSTFSANIGAAVGDALIKKASLRYLTLTVATLRSRGPKISPYGPALSGDEIDLPSMHILAVQILVIPKRSH